MVEGDAPADLAVTMAGATARAAWEYSRRAGCPLVVYVWDLQPWRVGSGRFDPVWAVGRRLIRMPRPFGGYAERRGYLSRLRYIAARSAEVWVPSGLTAEAVRRHYQLEPVLVPWCYDSGLFRPSTATAPGTALITVSRLHPQKNQAAVIRAAARMRPMPPVRLVGRGAEGPSLLTLAGRLGVDCSIESDLSDAQVAEAYRSAAVVVCPSRFEGFGATPLEAVASGARVVASDIPPHREFVGGAAEFFPLDDDAALVRAIDRARSCPPAGSAAVRQLSIEAAAARIAARFRSILS